MMFRLIQVLAAIGVSAVLFAGPAHAGEIVGFNYPVTTYNPRGVPTGFKITPENFTTDYHSIDIAAVLEARRMIQITDGESYHIVKIDDVKFARPEKWANLGNSIEPVCRGGSVRLGQTDTGVTKGSRGLGVEPLCTPNRK